jgi:hypothetical protein
LDAGTITQSSFNLNISNEQQLADMNAWLARLSDSIATGQMPQEPVMDPATSFAYNQMSNFNPPEQVDYTTQYPMVVPTQNNMYPTSCEENDMYVRSQPISQPVVPSQNNYLNQMQYPQQYSQPNLGLTGQRQHYTTVPNVSNQYFQPELRTAVNFTNANNPDNAKVEKEETVSYKPTKSITHDDKKNLATLVNTFSSALVDKKPAQTKKVKEDEESQKKESKADDLIRELITSDLSKLSLSDDGEIKKTVADKSGLYPMAASEKAPVNKHLLLLKKIQEWVNENYRKDHPLSTIIDSSHSSVLCQ